MWVLAVIGVIAVIVWAFKPMSYSDQEKLDKEFDDLEKYLNKDKYDEDEVDKFYDKWD